MIKYINFPTQANINYPIENKLYYNENKNAKSYFTSVLTAYKYYCPYCGSDLSIRTTIGIAGTFEREHTIEKKQHGIEYKHLLHCKYNLCISCSKCNKNKKDKTISIKKDYLDSQFFENNCSINNCSTLCETYKNSITDYINKNKIIAHPYGVSSKAGQYNIIFDTRKNIFIPENNNDYTSSDRLFIETHIRKFKLNTENPVRLKDIIDMCYYLITHSKTAITKEFIRKTNYNNIIELIFMESLIELDYEQQYLVLDELYYEFQK